MSETDLSILISMPSLKDSIFSSSLILMAEQNASGALGFIVNVPTNTTINEALEMMNLKVKRDADFPILFGGPVQTDFFWVLHSPEFHCKSTIHVYNQLNISSALDILPILEKPECPEIFHAGIGYAGWGPNQLGREIEEGSWWLTRMEEKDLFSTPFQERWDTSIKSLGVDPDHLFDFTDPLNPSIN